MIRSDPTRLVLTLLASNFLGPNEEANKRSGRFDRFELSFENRTFKGNYQKTRIARHVNCNDEKLRSRQKKKGKTGE